MDERLRMIIKNRMLMAFILIVVPIAVWLLSPALPILLSFMFAIGCFLVILQAFEMFKFSIMTLLSVAVVAIVGMAIWLSTNGFKLATVSISSVDASGYVLVFICVLGLAVLWGWINE